MADVNARLTALILADRIVWLTSRGRGTMLWECVQYGRQQSLSLPLLWLLPRVSHPLLSPRYLSESTPMGSLVRTLGSLDLRGSPTATRRSKIVRVQWRSRTTGFDNTTVETVIQKACAHYHLDANSEKYILVGIVDGIDLELSDDMMNRLQNGSIITRFAFRSTHNIDNKGMSARQGGPNQSTTMQVFLKTLTGKTHAIETSPFSSIHTLKLAVKNKEGIPTNQQFLYFEGRPLESSKRLIDYNIQRESTIHLRPVLRGGKPVIYLFPHKAIPHTTISVRLIVQWSFSHTYPVVKPRSLENGMEGVTWSVSAHPDGSMVSTDTGLELSYLFWEVLSNPAARPSPPPEPIDAPRAMGLHFEVFDPASPFLDPSSPTAVMLPVANLLPYLDSVLKSLTLHTSARNDFITYWLPALSKQPFVAVRFLPQAAYERAAELEVEPKPDVVTRVFMLFRGVREEEVEM
ncbi:hypothetical protein C8Q80DRAFT_1120116 [Daedaleopsis nitida]|nr:hypothetical protein C8Q80DRAFT_1120116 [Daedaleopsis nitida]